MRKHQPSLPEPGHGEVRVRLCWLRATAPGIDPGDDAAAPEPPCDAAGVVDAIGAAVPVRWLGLPVWIGNARTVRAVAAASPYVSVPCSQAMPLPDGVPIDAGACLGTPALTAMHAVLMDGGATGKRVLVASGAGAVWHYAVQFARLSGAALVVAAVGSAIEAGLALDAGAHATLIDGDMADSAERIEALTGGHGIDRVIEADAAANLQRAVEWARDEGDIVVHGGVARTAALPLAAALRKNLRLRFVAVHRLAAAERERATFELQAWLERGLIRHQIAARLPLARIAEAHELLRSRRTCGSVLLALD